MTLTVTDIAERSFNEEPVGIDTGFKLVTDI